MGMQNLLSWLKDIAATTPLSLFVFMGSILEELIPPIPAPVIMSFAGYLADQRSATFFELGLLALIGAFGKTLASLLLYWLGYICSNLIVRHPFLSQKLGITEQKIVLWRKLLTQKWWDEVFLIFVRAVPVVPTFLVSLGSGLIHLPLRTFIWTTFFGTVLRNIFLLWLGVYGTVYVQKFWEQEGQNLSRQPLVITCAILGLMLGVFIATKIKRKIRL